MSIKTNEKNSSPVLINARSQQAGFSLQIALFTALAIGASMTAAATIGLSNFKGIQRQSLARSAREYAEAGAAEMIETLNSNYGHLLVADYDKDTGWTSNSVATCPGASSGTPDTTGTIGSTGSWELDSYTFTGSSFFGGTGEFKFRGEYASNGDTKAVSIVTQTLGIETKSCQTPVGQPTSSSGFFGLLGQTITLGGNDVLGKLSGNVHCINCQSIADLGGNSQSIIGGTTTYGPLALPPVPTAPESLNLYANPYSCTKKCGDIEIVAGEDNSDLNCAADSEGVTHCVFEKLLIKNGELKIDSTNGPVRLYFVGTGEIFKSTGNGGIRHTTNPSSDRSSGDLSIFGNPADPTDSVTDQEFTIRGASDSNNLWVYLPDGDVGIAGGAQDNSLCDEVTGECTGGDIYGAVWAKSWGQTSGASSGTGVQIVVPPDMGNIISQQQGQNFNISLRTHKALDVRKWSSWTSDN